MAHQSKREAEKDPNIDQAGERGGDTGPSSTKGDGPQAEKGDWRRDEPGRGGSGKSRPHGGRHNNRSGSESNAS